MIKAVAEVQEVLTKEKISADEFQAMLKGAALVTHGLGNRRFHNWLFRIRGDQCVAMNRWVREVTKPGSQDMVAHEDCEHCDGAGCEHCDHIGQVRVIYQRQRSANNEKAVRYR